MPLDRAMEFNGLNLICQKQSAEEKLETYSKQHLLVICLEKIQAKYFINGSWQNHNYEQGDIMIVPANEACPQTKIDREVALIELYLEPQILSVNGKAIDLLPQLQLRDPLIREIGLALKRELETEAEESILYVESMTTALAVHLWRKYTRCQQEINNTTKKLPKYKLNLVIAYINEYLERNLSYKELANLVEISPDYFATLFKQSTGLTPYQYVRKCRIEKAKQLLVNTDLNLSEIGLQVGFQTQSHFTRIFRKLTNTTPKIYRNNNK